LDHSYCSVTSAETATTSDTDPVQAQYTDVEECIVCDYTETVTSTHSLPAAASCRSHSENPDDFVLPPESQLHEQPARDTMNTARKQRYRHIVNRLRVQVHRARKVKGAAACKVKRMTTTAHINHIVQQASEFLPDLILNFFMSQMKVFKKSENRVCVGQRKTNY